MTLAVAVSSFGYTGPIGRELVTAPTVPLLTIEEVRRRLRVPFTDEDVQLQEFIEAATVSAEEHLGRRLAPQVWRFWYDGTPCGREVVLPEPARSIASITSYATDDDTVGTALTSTEYVLDVRRDRVVFDEATLLWPVATTRVHNAVAIQAAVGFATVAAVPAPIKQAVQLKVQAMYQRFQFTSAGITDHLAVRTVDEAYVNLLAPYRYRMGVA
jgi:uncharacterized phiE125 gp8 family phage protein